MKLMVLLEKIIIQKITKMHSSSSKNIFRPRIFLKNFDFCKTGIERSRMGGVGNSVTFKKCCFFGKVTASLEETNFR